MYADDEYAQWHEDTDITLVSWASQAAGFFADIYPRDGSAPSDIIAAYFTEDNFEKLKRAQELAKEKGSHVESINIALAYVLNQSFPIAAVAGPRNVKELESTWKVLDISLTPKEIDYLSLRSSTR